MLLNKIRRRIENTVNAGSMADIAFLLLIFFFSDHYHCHGQGDSCEITAL